MLLTAIQINFSYSNEQRRCRSEFSVSYSEYFEYIFMFEIWFIACLIISNYYVTAAEPASISSDPPELL